MADTEIMLRKLLLVGGILSSLIYVFTDIFGGLIWGNYDFTSQYISELGAIGAPSRPLVIPLYIVYDVLIAAFGLGVWRYADGIRKIHFTGGLLIGYMIIGAVGLFFPMNPGEDATSLTNIMHQLLAGVTVVLILLSIGFTAIVFGTHFRVYSIGTILVYLVLGALPFLGVAQVEAGEPTPWVGLVERIMVYGYMLWVAVLASVLLRTEKVPNLIG
ncbi:MAG: DUF998 domain-containing protein [Candidatus Sifarchaeia archaeon]